MEQGRDSKTFLKDGLHTQIQEMQPAGFIVPSFTLVQSKRNSIETCELVWYKTDIRQ